MGNTRAVRGGIDRRDDSATTTVSWSSFVDAYEATLPGVYRYLYRGTGGDAALTDELTRATYVAAARAVRKGGDMGPAGLGPLYDTARALLVDSVTGRSAGRRRSRPAPPAIDVADMADMADVADTGADPVAEPVDALRRLRVDLRVILALRGHDELPPAEVARLLRMSVDGADALVDEGLAMLGGCGTGEPLSLDQVRDLFATLDARPGTQLADDLRTDLQGDFARGRRGARSTDPLAAVGQDLRPTPEARRRGGVASARRLTTRPRWIAPVVAVLAAVVVVIVASNADDRSGGPGAPADGRGSSDMSLPPAVPPPDPLAPAPLDTARPATTGQAEVIAQVPVGPGGPYMNGPYAIAAGDEGVWATAIDDDGTWRAVRVDAATGDVVAEIPVPGRVPSDRRHHGIALSGGFVWIPAGDGLLRIDADTNRSVGTVPAGGGVDGAALDGGDGAVWAVAYDGVLRRFDASTSAVTSLAIVREVGLMPDGIDLAYSGGSVWVTVASPEGRHLIAFDPTTLDRTHHVIVPAVGRVVDAYDLAALDDHVVITERTPGGVSVVDGDAERVLGQHEIPTASIGMQNELAWVSSPAEGLATAVAPTGDLVATVAIPTGVEKMAFLGDGTVWAARPGDGDLVKFRIGTAAGDSRNPDAATGPGG